MKWALPLFLFLSAKSFASFDVPPEKIRAVARSEYWHRLVHYKPRWTGYYRSKVSEPAFFLSPAGRSDPEAELVATLEAFYAGKPLVGELQQPPACAFPERFRFLKAALGIKPDEPECKDFHEWRKRLGAESVTLVFSSAYPNNPASLFGHTLLRLGRKKEAGSPSKIDLLDYGLNFAAMISEHEPGLKYALWGIFGGYTGRFTTSPYYMKVNEYSNSESRDLWEYDLNLNPDQVDRFVNHVWEVMATGSFTYYFIDENCSYQLLSLLEVVVPEWDLTSRFHTFVLPADTIKAVASHEGAIKSVRFRPALRKKMLQKRRALGPEQRRAYDEVLSGKAPVESMTDVAVASAVVAYYDYAKYRDATADGAPEEQTLRRALVRRAKLGKEASAEKPPEIAETTRPDLGHGSSAFGLRLGYRADHEKTVGLSYKLGLHDLLNDDLGWEPYSAIDFLDISGDYLTESHKIRLRELKLLELVSLYPLEKFDAKVSWTVSSRFDNFADFACRDCVGFRTDGGAGAAVASWGERALIYGLALGNVELSPRLPKYARAGPGLAVAGLVKPIHQYHVQLLARANYDLVGNFAQNYWFRYELNQAYAFGPAWDARLTSFLVPRVYRGLPNNFEVSLGVNHYF